MSDTGPAATHATPGDPLVLASIRRRFGNVQALDDVTLTVRPGTVHALLGENGAGKTTLMRIAYGMTRPDAGTIVVDGEARAFASPADAIAAGIGMVHQHFTLVPAMTVAENVTLGGQGRWSTRDAARLVDEVADSTGFALDPRAVVGTLAIGAQQRVEIAKALARRARLLVLDEPTGVLAPAEVDDLLRWLRTFVGQGNAAVLITHKLREALAVADDVTVLRRGVRVVSVRAGDASEQSLTTAMIGGQLEPGRPPVRPNAPRPGARRVFQAVNVEVRDANGIVRLREATFDIRAGEVVGIAGVEGSGQRELLRALAGRLPIAAGTLERPSRVGWIPEDRLGDAILPGRSLTENVALRGLGHARGVIDWDTLRSRTRALMSAFDVRASGPDAPMHALSGGNQQKLVLARELSGRYDGVEGGEASGAVDTDVMRDAPNTGAVPGSARGAPPEMQDATESRAKRHRIAARVTEPAATALVVENPTRGLDVRATAAVHARLRDAALQGAAVVIYASDLDEVLLLASRVLVVFDGIVHEAPLDRTAIGRAMIGLP